MLAGHQRFMVHGAAVERDGTALLLLGNSGAGKSTLAAAALDAGWHALSDDLTIVEPDCRRPAACTACTRRPRSRPRSAGSSSSARPILGDPRERVGARRDVLTQGGHRIGGSRPDRARRLVRADRSARLRGHEVLPTPDAVVRRERRAGAALLVLLDGNAVVPASACGSSVTPPTPPCAAHAPRRHLDEIAISP